MKTIHEIQNYFLGTNYKIIDGWLYRSVMRAKGESLFAIANFIPYIISEEIFDDGSDLRRYFIIEGVHSGGYALSRIKILSTDFSACNWITKSWGAKCNLEPTSNSKELLRHAIQLTAKDIPTKTTFGHLGFRKLDRKWIYIHGNGSIGDKNVCVELNQKLAQYKLTNTIFSENESFSELLNENFIPRSISMPLLGITFLSPLNEFLKLAGFEPKSVILLSGKTGSKKSTIAALFLSYFGKFTNTDLPLSFRDTENSIVEQTFLLKDTLTVIDDFHPSSRIEEMSMNKTAQTIMRAFGDRVGKNRLRSDSTLIPSKPPRGNAIITGESTPDISESGTARYLTIEVKKEEIDVSLLSELQDKARQGWLASNMYQYIQWIIAYVNSNEVQFINQLREMFSSIRNEFQSELSKNGVEVHSRIPESVAWLYLGFRIFLQFYSTLNILNQEELETLNVTCFEKLYNLAVLQAEFIQVDKPTDKFLKKLNSLFNSKSVYVERLDNPQMNSIDGFIGYEDDTYYYLIADIVHKKVKRLCDEQGENFTTSTRSLLKQLGDESIIEVRNNERTLPIRVGKTPQRLMWLKKNIYIERVS